MPDIDILDIGAMIEGQPRWASIYQSGRGRLTLVEPNDKEADLLRQTFGDDIRLLDQFLGDGQPATLHVTHYPGCASILEPDPQVIDKFTSIDTGPGSNFHVIDKVPVETTLLDDISPTVRADVVKIDVQGSELKILENGIQTLQSAVVVEMEAEFIPIYRDQPLFGDLQVFMRSQGFVLHKFIDVASRCFHPLYFNDEKYAGMSQLLWADAIFVRDFAALSAYSDEDLKKAAYILQDMYGSFDFVFMLLGELDRRLGSSYAVAFAKKLSTYPELPKLMLNMKEEI